MSTLAGIRGVAASSASLPAAGTDAGGGLTQDFYGPMGYSKSEVIDEMMAKGRRILVGVNIPKVKVG